MHKNTQFNLFYQLLTKVKLLSSFFQDKKEIDATPLAAIFQ